MPNTIDPAMNAPRTATTHLRALIADDEPLARERLRFLLSADPQIEIAAECRNGLEVVSTLRAQSPEAPIDVLFLDIQMPGRGGFEALEELARLAQAATQSQSAQRKHHPDNAKHERSEHAAQSATCGTGEHIERSGRTGSRDDTSNLSDDMRAQAEQTSPHIPITIFVTAHDHYAVRAFEVHALDYLTKPVEPERLRATLARVRERIASNSALAHQDDLHGRLHHLLQERLHARLSDVLAEALPTTPLHASPRSEASFPIARGPDAASPSDQSLSVCHSRRESAVALSPAATHAQPSATGASSSQTEQPSQPDPTPRTYPKRLLVPDGQKDTVIHVHEIEWIEAADYYACLHVGARSFMLRETVKQLATTLDPAQFVRIHRSAIVNMNFVREIAREGRGEGAVILNRGQRLRMSKTGWQNLVSASRTS